MSVCCLCLQFCHFFLFFLLACVEDESETYDSNIAEEISCEYQNKTRKNERGSERTFKQLTIYIFFDGTRCSLWRCWMGGGGWKRSIWDTLIFPGSQRSKQKDHLSCLGCARVCVCVSDLCISVCFIWYCILGENHDNYYVALISQDSLLMPWSLFHEKYLYNKWITYKSASK